MGELEWGEPEIKIRGERLTGEVWLDGERWRSTEPDQERSGVQRDGSRGRGTDGTETRTLGKRAGRRERSRDGDPQGAPEGADTEDGGRQRWED